MQLPNIGEGKSKSKGKSKVKGRGFQPSGDTTTHYNIAKGRGRPPPYEQTTMSYDRTKGQGKTKPPEYIPSTYKDYGKPSYDTPKGYGKGKKGWQSQPEEQEMEKIPVRPKPNKTDTKSETNPYATRANEAIVRLKNMGYELTVNDYFKNFHIQFFSKPSFVYAHSVQATDLLPFSEYLEWILFQRSNRVTDGPLGNVAGLLQGYDNWIGLDNIPEFWKVLFMTSWTSQNLGLPCDKLIVDCRPPTVHEYDWCEAYIRALQNSDYVDANGIKFKQMLGYSDRQVCMYFIIHQFAWFIYIYYGEHLNHIEMIHKEYPQRFRVTCNYCGDTFLLNFWGLPLRGVDSQNRPALAVHHCNMTSAPHYLPGGINEAKNNTWKRTANASVTSSALFTQRVLLSYALEFAVHPYCDLFHSIAFPFTK